MVTHLKNGSKKTVILSKSKPEIIDWKLAIDFDASDIPTRIHIPLKAESGIWIDENSYRYSF
jgi:hypothetical protein